MSAPPDTGPALSPEFLAEDRGPGTSAAIWTFAALATITLGLRCYVRLAIRNIFGVDDWTACLAWALLICFIAVDTVAIHLGLGRHAAYLLGTISLDQIADITFYLWLGNAFAVMGNAFAKISFAFTLLRVLTQRNISILLWFIIASLFCVHAVLDVLIYVQCPSDVRSLWNPFKYPTECWPTTVLTNYALFTGAWSAAMDFILAALPWMIIPQLKMKFREKLGVAIAMSMGAVAGVAAIVKTVQLKNLDSTDPTFDQPQLVIWGCIEVATTIIASCIPTLRPIGSMIFGGSSRDRYGSASNPKDGEQKGSNSYQLGKMSGGNSKGNTAGSRGAGDEENPQLNPKGRGVTETLVTIGSKPSRSPAGMMIWDSDSDTSILPNGQRPGEAGTSHSAADSMAGSEGGNEIGVAKTSRDGERDKLDHHHHQIHRRPSRDRRSEADGIRTTREVRVQYD